MKAGSVTFRYVVPVDCRARLNTTCFRDGQNWAGAFSRWKAPEQVLDSPSVYKALKNDITDWLDNHCRPGTFSITVECPKAIGWAGAVEEAVCRGLPVGPVELNRRHALALMVDDLSIPAPRTNKLTLIYNLDETPREGIVVILHSIYPGRDVGPLTGDVSGREGVVFFSFDAPGDDGTYWKKVV